MEEFVSLVIAFITGGTFKSIVDYIIYRKRSNDKYERLFDNIHRIYKVLHYIKNHSEAKRVVIIKNQNGGGIPTVDSVITSTLLYEVYDHPLRSLKKIWRNQKVDEVYMKMARRIYTNGSAMVDIPNLQDSILKDLYAREGVTYVEQYKICIKNNSFIYMSVHYDRKPTIDSSHRDIMRIAVNSLKEIFLGDKNKSKLTI
jgi:hypothetical protein